MSREVMNPGMMEFGEKDGRMGPGFVGRGAVAPRAPTTPRVEIPKVSHDLWTNADQFKELFRAHFLEGKMKFVGINFDKPDSESRRKVVEVLLDRPWPWVTCLAAETLNRQQWHLEAASPVMMLVDTKGKVRYAGPAGGYLPKMLIEMELAQASSVNEGISFMPNVSNVLRGGRSSSNKGVLSTIFGGGSSRVKPDATIGGFGGKSDPNAIFSSSVAKEQASTQQQAVPAASQRSGARAERVSNAQARQMLRTAQVQKRLNPGSALNMCDEILERWPNSAEAEEAKLLIKSILRPRPQFKQLRQQEGKYTGD